MLRVMTWNIKMGGAGRFGAIASVIERENPLILALQELQGFDSRRGQRMAALAEELAMTPHLARSAFGQPVAVLVRPPLRIEGHAAVRWRLHHAAAVARVPTGTGPLTVVSTHLNPFSPYRRMREARWLAARYGSTRRLVVLAGDLNALDPGTDHADEVARLRPLYRRRHTDPGGGVDTRAIAAFAAAGFVDLWPRVGRSSPGCGWTTCWPPHRRRVSPAPVTWRAVARPSTRQTTTRSSSTSSSEIPLSLPRDLGVVVAFMRLEDRFVPTTTPRSAGFVQRLTAACAQLLRRGDPVGGVDDGHREAVVQLLVQPVHDVVRGPGRQLLERPLRLPGPTAGDEDRALGTLRIAPGQRHAVPVVLQPGILRLPGGVRPGARGR
jgi:exodeoxyribonuclease III